ncbi:MAG: HAD hydrolase-like protein [Actinomycetota bacterium]|nr:HAD hydrolase-like protein [Actinomycetota bacterium]
MRSRPSHVIFDLDGTLCDSSAGILWSFHATLDALGLSADEATLRRLIGPPLGESFRMLGVHEEKIDEVVGIYRDFYAERGVYEAQLYEGVVSTLTALAEQGVRLAVATAKRVDFAHQMLTSLGVARFFDQISGASMDLRVTSKFDIMSAVIAQWDSVHGPDVWMVGDRHFDMVAARAHEVSAVGALWGFGGAEELRDAGAHWLVARPRELVREETEAGSPVCMLEEVCDACGHVMGSGHPAWCPGPSDLSDTVARG